MELLAQFVDILIHLDRYLGVFVQDYGAWIYVLLFLIVFAETGLVVTPFLPGDSLLFVAGTLAAAGGMDVAWLCAILIVAAILGDTVNYWVGDWFGPKLFHDENARFLKKEYLDRTHRFYERHGGKTIIIARFVPIIRTFAPFVAGIGKNVLRQISDLQRYWCVPVGIVAHDRRVLLRQPAVRETEPDPGDLRHHHPVHSARGH